MPSKTTRRTTTIRDVAAHAGVSVATASRALSEHGSASAETRSLIERAARELGYKANAIARGLRMRRTGTVGLIVTDIVNPFYSALADGVLHCARRYGYHVILCYTNEDPSMEREYLRLLLEQRVEGIIAVPTGHNLRLWSEALGIYAKLVFVDRELSGINVDTILVDNVRGAREAITYLIGLGHRRIGILVGPANTTTGRDRLQGYYDALAEAGIPRDERLVGIGTTWKAIGEDAVQALLSLAPRPSAIFAANNAIAERTVFAVRERGLRIPDDISLVAFDDVLWASLISPKLTVVAQPTYNLGFMAMERLATRLQESDRAEADPLKIVLQPTLIIRDSCTQCHQLTPDEPQVGIPLATVVVQ